MKKQTKIIIGIVLAIAIVILVVSLVYPPAFKGLTSGTFGKAEKYHKEQMTEKDIQLRSEFVQDTGQLRSMIQGLIYFSLFSQNLSYTIDTCIRAFQDHGICTGKNNACRTINILEEYSVFIKNNTKTLRTTVRMLTDFYLKDTTDQSIDVEKNLRDFGNYVNRLNERDSIVESALRSMDGYLLGPSMKETKKSEIAQLKSIRDQLLLKGIQLAGMLQDKPLCSNLLSYALSSQPGLNVICGQANLNVSLTQEAQIRAQNLNSSAIQSHLIGSQSLGLVSDGQLRELIQSSQLQNAVKSQGELRSLDGSLVVYDKPNLQFVVCNQQVLSKLYSAADLQSMFGSQGSLGRLQAVTVFSQEGLKVLQSAEDLKLVYSSGFLGNALSSSELSKIISAQSIGSVSYGTCFIGVVNQLGNLGYIGELGVIEDN